MSTAPALDNSEVLKDVDPRDWRYRLRLYAREVSQGYAVHGCGNPLGHGVALQVLADGSGGFGGIETCSSVWACPVCSARIGMGRRAELLRLVEWAKKNDYYINFLTLTQRHHKGESLKDLWDRISKAWNGVQARASFKRFQEQFGWRGYVRAAEVTHGRHGWHVHAHMLIITSKPLDDADDLVELRGRQGRLSYQAVEPFLFDQWRSAIENQGGSVTASGMDLRPVAGGTEEIVAQYVGKGSSDIGLEMTMGGHKRGRDENRTPFQILADIAVFGEEPDVRLWREWLAGSKGRLQLVWSRGLKDKAGVAEMTDEEVAEQGPERETLGFISRDDYVDVLQCGLLPNLLRKIESSDIAGIIGTLGSRRSQ